MAIEDKYISVSEFATKPADKRVVLSDDTYIIAFLLEQISENLRRTK